MNIKVSRSLLIYILLVFTFFLTIQINLIYAADLTASQYELNLTLDYPKEIISNSIEINRTFLKANNSNQNKNIYLDSFTLKNSKGKEIPARYINIDSPHLKEMEPLDKRHRYLIMKNDQVKSWFKIGLSKEAGFLDPGEYTGVVKIDDLDWDINISLIIEPFVSFFVEDNTFEFEIKEPFSSDFFIADELYQVKVDSNHSSWEIQAHLEDFINEEGENLDSRYLHYRLENADRNTDNNQLQKNQFTNFKEDEMIILINGRDYDRGLRSIRFGVDLERDNAIIQPAGLYRGKIIFTLRILNNNL